MIDEPTPSPAGLRRRIVTPSKPAPVPRPRPVPTATETGEDSPLLDRSTLTTGPQGPTMVPPVPAVAGESSATDPAPAAPAATAASPTQTAQRADADPTSNESVVRSTGSMAIATILSRITGFLRTALIGAALGVAVADAFTIANTLPNLITEIVLGSVLTALVVPVLVRAEKEDPDRGAAFIRRLFTLTATLVTVVSIAAVATAPLLTRMMIPEDGNVNEYMSTSFAILLLPQIFFYGLFALFMAILNTKGIFRPGAWAPVANNIVAIAVLLAYMALPGQLEANDAAPFWDLYVLLLGVGTTLGVVVQCAIMIPPLRRAGIDLRPLWGIDARLKQFGGMAVAIVVYVAISQLGYVINTRIAADAAQGSVVIYSYHWLLLQVPYGVIGVALLTAIMPRLSRNAANGDDRAVVTDLTLATKLTFIALIPVIVFFTAFGVSISHALFRYGQFSDHNADLLGVTLSFGAFTLIPYSLVMLHLRVFYAREQAWTPTYIIAGITTTKVALAALAPMVATSPDTIVILLAAANGFGFVAGAFIGASLLRAMLGSLNSREVWNTSLWAFGSSVVGAGVALALKVGSDAVFSRLFAEPIWALQMAQLAVCGVVFLIVTGIVLSRSKLPEVYNLGRLFSRLPVVGRFIRVDEGAALELGETSELDLSAQLAALDAFTATPTPPPMSAGVVRGPRLVPGAPVSDGRFRLLVDCGSVSGARFWKARETATGKDVALTFVDTTGKAPFAPPSPAEMAQAAARVSRETRRLGELGLPAVASGVRILSYRTGALIVADWVEGSSLRDVARTAVDPDSDVLLNPQAVAAALAPLADAAADASASGLRLGLDNSARIRIATTGEAMLAFPAILDSASARQDAASIASAIHLLADATTLGEEPIDPRLAELVDKASAIAHRAASEPDDPADADATSADTARATDPEEARQWHELAAALRTYAGTPPSPAPSGVPSDAPSGAPQAEPGSEPSAETPAGETSPAGETAAGEPSTAGEMTASGAEPQRTADAAPVTLGGSTAYSAAHRRATMGRVAQMAAQEAAHRDGEPKELTTAAVGFGSSGYSRKGTGLLVSVVIALVILVAVALTVVTSVLSGPAIVDENLSTHTQTAAPAEEVALVFRPTEVAAWQAPGQDTAADNPQDLPLVADSDNSTSWASDAYPNGLGTKPGIGIAVRAAQPLNLERIRIDTPSAGARYSIYGIPPGVDPGAVTDLTSLPRIVAGEFTTGRQTISVEKEAVDAAVASPQGSTEAFAGVIVWITETPRNGSAVEIREIALVGHVAAPQAGANTGS
ncbi:murein biosynthesis integral membrane protein MurJ [Corynebacterium uterequi]|uniref:Murein biosynthesis integral membrane protein MurJ n=1 Tax=Corynebacterium uterequi TaxID=1072256 RepID=A0A0G3HJT0_9CORY|nr:murein biosynthesis integral membrane protein MurJ [Corynebacterium uterequi]AKK12183.1 murein biosynthesis integral membrane protein MurJ [Corynebacterium uterequi]